jgi:hypothetical protein
MTGATRSRTRSPDRTRIRPMDTTDTHTEDPS